MSCAGLNKQSRVMGRIGGALFLLVCASAALAQGTDSEPGSEIQYNRDIRPILAENCFSCHGPDSASRKADLRLDRHEDATRELETGTAAIVPGDPDTSELLFRVETDDPTVAMPPPELHKTVNAEQRDLLKRWIAGGAVYQPHWSFIPPVRPELPAVAKEDWVRNPIDRFILAGVEASGLTPAEDADRRTLARRVSLDLNGLPPAPEEVERFVNDPAPDAYERLVDRLLDSPRWGEHRARAWLDAARYADTHGFHFDNFREMWSYRDWVINAFNRNMPFDTFTLEQIAGDLLPEPTVDQLVATGFNRCNMTTNEGGTIPEEYLVLYARDRTETVSQVWMGLTAGCAVCHDHKFDPLEQREFYEMAAFFNNTSQNAMDGNIKDTPPTFFVPDPEDQPRWETLQKELKTSRGAVAARHEEARGAFGEWLSGATVETLEPRVPSEGLRLQARISPRVGRDNAPPPELFTSYDSGNFERDQAFTASAWIKPERAEIDGSLVSRMDDQRDFRGWDILIDKGRIVTHLVNKWPENAIRVMGDKSLSASVWNHVAMTYDGSGKAAGIQLYLNGKPLKGEVTHDTLTETMLTDVPLRAGQRNTTARLTDAALSDLRLYGRVLSTDEAQNLAGATRTIELLREPAEARAKEELDESFAWWVAAVDEISIRLHRELAALEQEQTALRERGTLAHVMKEKEEPAMAYVLFRGEYDQRRDPVQADTPDVLPAFPADAPRNRLGFARWLLAPEHPLTARVTVNRYWQEVFGTGLVRSAGDFGITGELPSHPELLDWLAVEFRESGWDVKGLFRLMVTSAAYRQSASATPEKIEKDPSNRLLARGPRFRLEGEMIRDYALAASGLLVERTGGPSVRPYQPPGVWEAVAMPESNTRNYVPDTGEKLYRRSLYTFWKRAAPPALLELFNAPSRETCTVNRERTNTPLQALATLNDPTFVEAARHLAEIALREGDETDAGRIEVMTRRILARSLQAEELSVVEDSLSRIRAYYSENPEDAALLIAVGETPADSAFDPARLASWTLLANELFNLDEALNK